MRVLVTGATGFIGRSLVPYLAARESISVTILVRERYSHSGQLPPSLTAVRSQIEAVYADLRNFNLTVRAVQQAEPDYVIHLAAAGVTDPFLGVETALRHNLMGTVHLLRACFERGSSTQQVIVGRTPGESSAMNVYAASKAAAWNFCRMYGRTQQWPIHGAMIFQAYGPDQPEHTLILAALAAARSGQDFPMTAGTQERDWIYVIDVVAGLAAMLGVKLPPATTVDLGTGQLTPVVDVVRRIYALVDKGGHPLIGTLPGRAGEAQRQVADALRTQELIGWKAAIPLQEGLIRLIRHVKNS